MTDLASPVGAVPAAALSPTPTHSGMPHQCGGFPSITAALDHAAQGRTGLNFYSSRGTLSAVLSYRDLRSRALATAARLTAAGLRPGDRVAVIAETGPDFPTLFFACQYAGLVPCPVPFTTYVGGRDAYVARISRMLEACSARALVGPEAVATILGDTALPGGAHLMTFAAIAAIDEAPFEPAGQAGVAYVQFSSGSTAQPKGIVITQAAASANATAILQHGMRLTGEDRAFSWLPFYHDMGLVGFLLAPMYGQCSVDYLAPSAFVRRPSMWLQLIAQNGSTISYSPTFGYNLLAERFRPEEHAGLDLSAWRIAGVGGDMVRAAVLERFAERLAPAGFRREAFLPSYGLAEATLALSFATDGLATDRPGEGAERGFVVCGRPLPGHEIRIVDEDGTPLPEGAVGHVWARGPSLMQGYLGRPDLTDAVMRPGGYLATGDLGYLRAGQLVVTGRAKDLILVNGRNIWPEDIEWAALAAAGLSHGQVVAFPVEDEPGADRVVVLVEAGRQDAEAAGELRTRVASAVGEAAGVSAVVELVPPHTIPMTSSGKLRRAAARDAYVAGEVVKL